MTQAGSGTAERHAGGPARHGGQDGPGAAPQGAVPQGAADSWRVILSGRRGRLLAGLMLTELVAAVQILIVITVLPAVVRQLGGIRLYGLALSAAAVAGIGAAPVAVRLLGRFGARYVVPAGAVVFCSGALGAGLAGQMAELVIARFVEGAGAAALGAVAITSVSALYGQAQRPNVMVLGNLAWLIPASLARRSARWPWRQSAGAGRSLLSCRCWQRR